MPQITRLVAGKKNPNRVNLYIDGSFAYALSLDEVVRNHLKKGQTLTSDEILALKKIDDLNWVYIKLLNFLSYRPRTEFEVRNRLKKYGLTDASSISWVLEKLTTNGYLNDLAFAKWFVDSRLRSKPRSKQHLISELRAKGVAQGVISQVLIDQDDVVALEQLIIKKRVLSRDKLLAFLLRRGFKYSIVQAKLDELEIKG